MRVNFSEISKYLYLNFRDGGKSLFYLNFSNHFTLLYVCLDFYANHLRERPLMTSDFRVGRGVQKDPKKIGRYRLTSPKGFSASEWDVGNWIFSKF